MTSTIQSNPLYYSLATLSSGQNSSSKTVVLHKRADHEGFGIYIGEDIPSGLYIVTVERNSPASDANVQPGDRILAVNGELVSSMRTNPKEILVKAATNAQNLTLTIQSTNIFQTLNIPLTNSSKDNQHKQKRNLSRKKSDINTDLESYIRSLFTDENIQILPGSNNNEFIFKSDSHSKDFNSFPTRYYQSSGQKKERRHHRRSKRVTLLETKETQTSINEDQDENITQQTSPTRTYPSMGTSQRILRTQQQISNEDTTQAAKPLSNNTISTFTALPPSPTPDETSPYSTNNQNALPASTAAVFAALSSPTSNNATHNSTKTTQPTTQHMVDIVGAAMAASRNQEQPNSREQAPATKQSTTPPPSHGSVSVTKQATSPSSSRHPPANSAYEPAPTAKRTTNPPPSAHPPENSSRESTSVHKRAATPSRDQPPPPPYTETANTNTSSEPVNNRNSNNAGAYNVRTAAENQTGDDGLREIHLHRLSDFQGFGFHLQYNRSYYLVQRVEVGSPAERSGLHANDVIHSVNGQKTAHMSHDEFVGIVNASSDVKFLVQSFDEYKRTNPLPIRNSQATTTAAAPPINNDNDKRKNGVSKVLSKITSR